jgi:adenylate dimethylallyltransferase (cytokinin synthase)
MSSLYLAPTPAFASAAVTLPRLLAPPPIDIRRIKCDMALQVPPPPPHIRRLKCDMALQVPPLPLPLIVSTNNRYAGAKHKVVVVMSAMGTGKSRLAVDLALEFGGEVINSDKIQVYEGLDVATNKVTEEERAGVPHHLIGVARPDDQFTATDFRHEASSCARVAASRSSRAGRTHSSGSSWTATTARSATASTSASCGWTLSSRGIWRAIGVPELDAYLRCSGGSSGEDERARLMLADAIEDIKSNTYVLACRQRAKIEDLTRLWRVVRVDATEVLRRRGLAADEGWQRLVAAPCIDMVRAFLNDD